MGSADRLVRVLAAIAIVVLFFNRTITGTWGYVLLAVAAIFLLTSVVGLCPLYAPFGIHTCKTKKEPAR